MKLLFVLGSRGEWGYIRPIIRDCIKRSIEYSICATNMVLLSENGLLVNEIEQEGFSIGSKVLMSLEGSTNYSMAKSVGLFASSFVDILMQEKPDWTILAGDRGEQLAAALACSYSYIPCAHIQAGERSGNIDGIARHAIGKLVHLHFAANSDAFERLKRLGEQDFRVHNVGAPQLDEIYSEDLLNIDSLEKELNISLKNGFLLIVQHPVTEQLKMASENTSNLLKALEKFSLPKIIILPNNDAGSSLVKEKIFATRRSDMYIFSNLTRKIYLSLLKECSCIVGNSSSGLLEAPSFRTPAVNIGIRQQGRVQGENVINCEYDSETIIQSINKALSLNFKKSLASSKNPYGDGKSTKRIIDLLLSIKVDDNLLIKEITS